MYIILGLAALILIITVVLLVSFKKDKVKKEPIKTVRTYMSDAKQEPDSRYRSVTETLGHEDETD